MRTPEILAPAGSFEALEAAVRCGADAVYLGGADFSARQNAANFDDAALVRAVEYCHLRGVRVHQAVNTIVFDGQMDALQKTVKRSAEIGVDALIVQDFGVLEVLRQILPDMPLHASTQMTVHTKQGVLFAKEKGFSRVVTARELSKEQLAALCALGVEIEVFVHGALCMSVSGQCYMSAMIGSRSANRGLCAQACRLPFSAVEGESRCDLSLKDLSLVTEILELAEMGVASLKIEGRMKRPEYVAAAVTACRAAADGREPDMDALQAVFSRSGFTDGYFRNRLGKDMFGIRRKEDVVSADEVFPRLKELYRKDKKASDIQFEIEVSANQPAVLRTFDGDGNTAEVTGEVPQTALNRPSDLAQAEKQLSKLGDTVYNFGGVSGRIGEGLMLPASALNELRRSATEKLDSIRIEKYKPDYTICNADLSVPKPKRKEKQPLRLELSSVSQLKGLALDGVKQVILPLGEVFAHADELAPLSEKVCIAPPRFLTGAEEAEKLHTLHAKGFSQLYCMNPAHIRAGQAEGFSLHGGFGLNASNSQALKAFAGWGMADTVVSIELKVNQILQLGDFLPYGVLVHGRLPLMLTRNCPIQSAVGCKNCTGKLTDRTGRSFEVVCDGVTAEILNSDVLYMADRLGELPTASFFQLKFNREKPAEIQTVLRQYQGEKAEKPPEFTRGLYYRGVEL